MDTAIIEEIREELRHQINENTRASSRRFFKEKIYSYGVRVPAVNKISKKFFKRIASATKTDTFDLCERLWQSGYLEESFIACNWSYYIRTRYKPEDFEIFETDPIAYMNSIKKLLPLSVTKILPAHHDLNIPVSIIEDIDKAFSDLYEKGVLKHGTGTFIYKNFGIKL